MPARRPAAKPKPKPKLKPKSPPIVPAISKRIAKPAAPPRKTKPAPAQKPAPQPKPAPAQPVPPSKPRPELWGCLRDRGIRSSSTSKGHKRTYRAARALLSACKAGDLGAVTQLLLQGDVHLGPLNALEYSPILAAVMGHEGGGRGDIVAALLRAGADPRTDTLGAGGWSGSVLHMAAQFGNDEAAAHLLGAGADVNARQGEHADWGAHDSDDDEERGRTSGATPLFLAARAGHAAVVQVLLAAGADVHIGESNGATPLIVAASDRWDRADERAPGRAEVVRLLLGAGASVNAATRSGKTALLCAAAMEDGAQGIVKTLLDAGADASVHTARGADALGLAVAAANVGAVRALLQHGADPSVAFNGVPLLVVAAGGRCLSDRKLVDVSEIIGLLIKAGADPNAGGGAALAAAIAAGGRSSVMNALLDNGALSCVDRKQKRKLPGT